MRIFFALMLLFASLTYAATAQAADFCAAHGSSAVESGLDADCSGHGDNTGGADCPDCTHHCHSAHIFPDTKPASGFQLKAAQAFVPMDDLLHGRCPASLLRPPQQV
ncbi:MAG: hypothetical protein H3C49_08445 [Alphaproteobacteria bacterium]|nr:hypothetical protein [Alphaproteobacteria bacterium]